MHDALAWRDFIFVSRRHTDQRGTPTAGAPGRVAVFVRVVNRPVSACEAGDAVAEFIAVRFAQELNTYHQKTTYKLSIPNGQRSQCMAHHTMY